MSYLFMKNNGINQDYVINQVIHLVYSLLLSKLNKFHSQSCFHLNFHIY
jgi:hypothetical protein